MSFGGRQVPVIFWHTTTAAQQTNVSPVIIQLRVYNSGKDERRDFK